MGIFSFFSGIAQDGYNGLTWFYNHTVGYASTWFQGEVLSGAESFVESMVSAGLGVFGVILSTINGLFSSFFASMISISASMGIWALPIVAFIVVSLMVAVFLLIKTILDLL